MMVGHALLAFALVVLVADALGATRDRALALGVVAGAFAALPDVDMLYALSGLARVDYAAAIGQGVGGAFAVTHSFWSASTVVHRTATHSVVLAVPMAGAAALWATGKTTGRAVATATVLAVAAVSWTVSGSVDGSVVLVFGVAVLGVAAAARRWADLSPRAVAALAAFGVASHPFGDLFTGQPPRLLYPFGVQLVTERIALSPDPTLHLLGAFAVELAVIWLAILAYARVSGVSLRRAIAPRASLAVAYGLSALVLQPPTLNVSYHFVFSVVGVGAVLAVPAVGRPSTRRIRAAVRRRTVDPDWPSALVVTGTSAVTLAWAAYLLAYLLTRSPLAIPALS